MSATPHPSIFEFPELVGLVAQYLSSQDIVHCIASSKSWAHHFKPLLWRDVVLKRSHRAPQALALNRHRIRSLSVASNDAYNLHMLAADLPNTFPGGSPQGPRDPTCSSTTENNIFPHLRIIRVDHKSEENASDSKRVSLCMGYVLRILNQSPGLLQLAPPENILNFPSDHTKSFLYTLAHKLPCIRWLDIRGEGVPPKIGLEFLRVCLNHPQLANLHCYFSITGQRPIYGPFEYFSDEQCQLFKSFFTTMENDKKAREATGKPAVGSPIKSLILPKTASGYPPDFICTLLRTYLPNLERLHAPKVMGDGNWYTDASFKKPLMEAVAQGCPKLQHLRCSWYEGGCMDKVINGIVKGCQEWGLKSFYCEDLDDQYGRRILATLSRNHSKTLEEVELANCQDVKSEDVAGLFLCKNLKSVKIWRGRKGCAGIEIQDVNFGCHDLTELQLTITQPNVDPEHCDFGSDEDEDYEDFCARLERFDEWLCRISERAYTQIGSLSKLETLSLNRDEWDGRGYDYDLTLEKGWLRQLAGLKELKHFHMATDLWVNMGQAEVEFMDAQWPKLEKIEFSKNMKSQVKKRHWKWLQARRPGLVYGQRA
ncbi:MAG: hypothetical protein J3Q66DRAFT_330791 [Benniella sp.]|nr:MAG: hypothetical protein J3Q66DRAFT_330791 [Benniella sp.]